MAFSSYDVVLELSLKLTVGTNDEDLSPDQIERLKATAPDLASHLAEYFGEVDWNETICLDEGGVVENVNLEGTHVRFRVSEYPDESEYDDESDPPEERLRKELESISLADTEWEACETGFWLILDPTTDVEIGVVDYRVVSVTPIRDR